MTSAGSVISGVLSPFATLVLVGVEASTQSGHLLRLGIPDPVFRFSGDAPDALDDMRNLRVGRRSIESFGELGRDGF